MKFSTWNWQSHPTRKIKGIAIGPFFGVIAYISVPTPRASYGLILEFRRVR